jgi:RNA polymerase-interacting CarD/CdnL/TRCF family regulator
MARARAVIVALVGVAVGGMGCASAPDEAVDEWGPGDGGEMGAVAPVEAWFAVRGVPCEAVVPALGVAATLREGQASPWRHAELASFCAVGPAAGQRAMRIDSLVMQVSETTAAPAIAFYVSRGSWSYTVFDRGEPVLALESHLGPASLEGDLVQASGLIGGELEPMRQSLENCRDIKQFDAFVAGLGLSGFRLFSAESAPASVPTSALAASDASATLSKIPAGTWAALPPLGVVLVRAVEIREKNGVSEPTYVIVSGMNTLELPVIRAEKMGMRPLATAKQAKRVLDFVDDGVASPGRVYDANRVKDWLDLVRSGDLDGIARVYATLCALKGSRRLYQVEEALMASTLDWLSQELAAAQQLPSDVVERALKRACN